MFNILMDVHIRYIIIKVILAAVGMLCMTLIGAFIGNYLDDPNGDSFSRTMCYICCFSPPLQLFYGLIFIIYRYPLYVLKN